MPAKTKPFDVTRLPFDLPAQVYHTIVVAPEVARAMLDGSPAEIEALEAIVTHWEHKKATHPEFGITIGRKFGFSAPEEKLREDNSAAIRANAIASFELQKKISKETGIEVFDIQKALNKTQVEGVTEEYLIPYLDDFLKLSEDSVAVDAQTRSHTILIRRAIPTWTDELTQALHPEISKALNDFLQMEFDGLPTPKESTPSPIYPMKSSD
jgi:hypothetical protein